MPVMKENYPERGGPTLRHDPLGVYKFQLNGNDSSGNGRNLSPTATATWGDGFIGPAFEQEGTISFTLGDAAFAITNGLTVWGICKQSSSSTSTNFTVACYANGGELEAENALWSLSLYRGTDLTVRYLHEAGAGVNYTYDAPNLLISTEVWLWVGFTRDDAGTGINLYLNGINVGSTTLAAAPTGGTTNSLFVGTYDGGDPFTSKIDSLKIIPKQLTDAEMRLEYEESMGIKL